MPLDQNMKKRPPPILRNSAEVATWRNSTIAQASHFDLAVLLTFDSQTRKSNLSLAVVTDHFTQMLLNSVY